VNKILVRRGAARRTVGLCAAVVVGLGSLTLGAVAPASADTGTAVDGATATVSDVVLSNSAIHLEGTGWTTAPGSGVGSTIAVKLGDALTTEPASGPVINPATGTSADDFNIWDAIQANDDGTFSADITFPTPDNTNPALASPWAVGTTHTLRLLTGSMRSGDTGRSVLLTFTVGEGLVASATTATTGVVTVSVSGGNFTPGEVLSVAHGETPLQWTITSGRTSTTSDTLTVPDSGVISARVVLPAGMAPAGRVTLTITGDGGTHQSVTVQVPPSVSFDNGTAIGASGTLTLGNLVTGATITSVKLGDTVLATDLTADSSGNATAAYAIPVGTPPTVQSLVISQTAPSQETYTLSQAVYPDESTVGADKFTIVSTTADQGLYQGFYQSAYSATQDALYVTASDRGTGNNGFIYKLDPDTLEVETSHQTVDHDDFTKTGAFGIGVDDVNGNIWVSNTGSSSVAVYKASDLSLVKQFPAGVVSHSRDVVYDPSTDQVFVSSASEGSSAAATGYLSVFEAADKDGDGTPYEKITDIETGTRDVFNPVSLSLADGTLFSPSLGSNKVVRIDTAHATEDGYEPTFLTVDGINVGGRGASGIAYDAAHNRIFVASQNSHDVTIANATTGATINEVPTGRQALNVVLDPVHEWVYVANFGGTSVTVLDTDGNKVASLPIATANHVSTDGKGNVFVVDKAASNRVWKIMPNVTVEAGTPTISGTARVGVKLTAKPGAWGEGTELSYQWNRNGTAIDGATKVTYTPVAADAGKKLTVTVTGTLPGAEAVAKTSAAKTVAKGKLKAAKPTVTGKARVGKTLTAKPGKWTAGTAFTFRWLANGKAIKGATGTSLKLTRAMVGKKIQVKVTGAKAGYVTATKASKKTGAVRR